MSEPDRRPSSPELTVRAVVTGMLLGALLTPCNVYSGLKIGWSFNMSIAAALLSFGFWRTSERALGTRRWELLESNINQTTASSAASIISSGLVAPIPALALLTGQELGWVTLSVWVFSVSGLGILVAVAVRKPLLEGAELTFPAGVATAETIREIYGHGREAALRVAVLLASLVGSGAVKLYGSFVAAIPQLRTSWTLLGSAETTGRTISLTNLGFVFDPSFLMLGFGAIIGIRTGTSLLVGSIVAWGLVAPLAVERGWASPGPDDPSAFWFGPLVEWLLWPGVAMMVTASLTTLVLTAKPWQWVATTSRAGLSGLLPTRSYGIVLVLVSILVVTTQMAIFGVSFPLAALAVPISFVLGLVAARVVGETGIPPIGALGKISQLSFGAMDPANVTTNLMTANVAGGTAGQCADLLNDLKTGHLVGARPRRQVIAQWFGIVTGSLVGSAVYLVLIPDPRSMLLTPEWPAPAVATWKAVAEALQHGISSIPRSAVVAMTLGALLGTGLPMLRGALGERAGRFVPSLAGAGLAFVIPAWISISLFAGALLAWLAERLVPGLAARFTLAVAAGLVAGESLAGVVTSVVRLASG